MFFKASDGTLFKVGPVAITTTGSAPNAAASGQVGNSIGEMWLDGRPAFSTPLAKVWNGTSWLTTSGFTVDNSTGNFSLAKQLTVSTLVANGSGSTGFIKVPSLDNAQSPESSVSSIGAIYFNTATNKFRGRNNTGWTDIGSGNLTDLTVSNNATIDGNLTVGGDTILGDDCGADTLTVNAVTSIACDTTIGASSSNTLTVAALSDFQSNIRLSSQADLRFHSGTVGASGYIGFQAPSGLTGATIWTLPPADGTIGQALVTNGSGVLSWGGGGGGGGATVTVSDTPPVGPSNGDLWYDSADGRLYIWYVDASSTQQWVDASPGSTGVTNIRVIDDVSASFDGLTTSFPLAVTGTGFSPVSPQQLIVSVGGVYQRPNVDYTVSGSNIQFTTAPTSGLTFSATALGAALTLNTVADNSIGTAKIQSGAVTASKLTVDGSLTPTADNVYNLGSPSFRFANVYTGDLHLKNDKGDWTMIEDEDFLTLRNNKTGKVYKLVMEEI